MHLVTHLPLLRTVAAALAPTAVWLLKADRLSSPGAFEALCFFAGLVYSQALEHILHRYPMHRRIRFLEAIRLSHLRHHRAFHGAAFQTRDPEAMRHIAGRWEAFPVLFAAHYLLLAAVAPPTALVAFLTAATLHYVTFEVSHWFTHLEDNAFDRALARVPVVRDWRARQIQHHRWHHEVPEIAFNFNPPYLGDVLAGRMPRHAAALGYTLPAAGEAAPSPTDLAATPSFWKRPAVRRASAIAAGVAGVALLGVAILVTRQRGELPS